MSGGADNGAHGSNKGGNSLAGGGGNDRIGGGKGQDRISGDRVRSGDGSTNCEHHNPG